MERTIAGFHRDDVGDWVAELSCGHDQHVRHRPPFQERAWVLVDRERTSRVGRPIDCPLCDRGELPAAVTFVRTGPSWDAATMPPALARRHRLGAGTWAVVTVDTGTVRLRADSAPPVDVELTAVDRRAVPPGVDHEVVPAPGARFHLEWFTVERHSPGSSSAPAPRHRDEAVGDPACWAHALCPDCGAVDGHRPGCGAEP